MNWNKKSSNLIVVIILFSILMLIPNVVFFSLKNQFSFAFASLAIPFGLFLIPFVFFQKAVKWYFSFLFLIALLAPPALLSVFYFGDRLNFEMVSLAFFTTYSEATELLSSYIWIIAILYIIYILLMIGAIKKLPKKISISMALGISLTGLILLISGLFVQSQSIYKTSLKNIVFSYFPFDLAQNIYLVKNYKSQMEEFKADAHRFAYSDVINNLVDTPQVFILLIGESARYSQWELNGYHRKTSPNLSNWNHVISFSNVAASGTITMYALPQILTGVTVDNYNSYLDQGGLALLFQQAGFKTYWLSNQEPISANTFIQSSFADTLIMQVNTTHSHKNVNQDLALIDIVQELLKEPVKKKLFIVHCSGSHYNYQLRYPSSFEKFKPVLNSQWARPTELKSKDFLVNAYDNTILYTDSVIAASMSSVKDFKGLGAVIYTSDHGENLFDDERAFVFHAPVTFSKYVAHVPLFLYGNPVFRNLKSEKWKILNENKNRAISNNQIFFTLADMAGIKFKENNQTQSFASDGFKDSPQKVMIGQNAYKNFKEAR